MHFASGLRGDPGFDVRAESSGEDFVCQVMIEAQHTFAQARDSFRFRQEGRFAMNQSV